VTPAELVAVTLKYGDIGTIRRMGALLEREGVPDPLLKKARKSTAEDIQPDPLDILPNQNEARSNAAGRGHQ